MNTLKASFYLYVRAKLQFTSISAKHFVVKQYLYSCKAASLVDITKLVKFIDLFSLKQHDNTVLKFKENISIFVQGNT